MALKATRLLRDAVLAYRTGRPELARALIREAGDWAIRQRQPLLASQAASLWDAYGGDPAVSERWRADAALIREERRALYRRW